MANIKEELQMCISELNDVQEQINDIDNHFQEREQEELYKRTDLNSNMKVLNEWLQQNKEDIDLETRLNNCQTSILQGQQGKTSQYGQNFPKFSKKKIDKLTKEYTRLSDIKRSKINKRKNMIPSREYDLRPTPQFMYKFIESTYNMINLINNRLDNLDNKLSKEMELQ